MKKREYLPLEIVFGLLAGEKEAVDAVLCHYYSDAVKKVYRILKEAGEPYDLEGLEDVLNRVLQDLSEAVVRDYPRFYERYTEMQ